jgi:hypothetical protein
MFWFVDRLLPGLVSGLTLLIIVHLNLYFLKAWPYWGRTHKKKE